MLPKTHLDANASPGNGMTLLIQSTVNGNAEMVQLLLDGNALVDDTDTEGSTALVHAAKAGHTDIVDCLLSRQANPNHKCLGGFTALMLASANNQPDVVKLLLAGKAHVDSVDSEGFTALMYAARNGYAVIVDTLLAAGSDPYLVSRPGLTAVTMAAKSDTNVSVFGVFRARKVNLRIPDGNGCTPLLLSVQMCQESLTGRLLHYGSKGLYAEIAPIIYDMSAGHNNLEVTGKKLTGQQKKLFDCAYILKDALSALFHQHRSTMEQSAKIQKEIEEKSKKALILCDILEHLKAENEKMQKRVTTDNIWLRFYTKLVVGSDILLATITEALDHGYFCVACAETDRSVLKKCKGCLTARFCSLECMKTAWPMHKIVCRAIQDEKALEEIAAEIEEVD